MSFYSEILNDSDDDHTGLYNEDLFVSKGKSKNFQTWCELAKPKSVVVEKVQNVYLGNYSI